MQYLTVDKFYSKAKSLRAVFDERFANPLDSHAERFVWDFWNVPGEYTHLRTPAYHYFPKKIYEPFHRYLVQWGREHLGCHDISPPWLSSYVTGCKQEPHQDMPHGPLAFVFSLTNWEKRKFKGGETFLKNPRTLIEPKFNRLTLFNPSVTHGVKELKGTMDPREGRLVIHGWFVNPRPFWVGPMKVRDVQNGIDRGLGAIPFSQMKLGSGFAAYRLKISKKGTVDTVHTLVETFANENSAEKLAAHLLDLSFRPGTTGTTLTLPLRIESSGIN